MFIKNEWVVIIVFFALVALFSYSPSVNIWITDPAGLANDVVAETQYLPNVSWGSVIACSLEAASLIFATLHIKHNVLIKSSGCIVLVFAFFTFIFFGKYNVTKMLFFLVLRDFSAEQAVVFFILFLWAAARRGPDDLSIPPYHLL